MMKSLEGLSFGIERGQALSFMAGDLLSRLISHSIACKIKDFTVIFKKSIIVLQISMVIDH